MSFATHFMTFERNLGEAQPVAGEKGVFEFATPAPPGEGWRWFGGENDGKLHGPLRITGFAIDCNNKRNAGDLELIDLRIDTECSPRRLVTLVADSREREGKGQFVATLRSLCDRPLAGDLKCTIRNWAGKTIEENTAQSDRAGRCRVHGRPSCRCLPASTNSWRRSSPLSAPGQDVSPVQAYFVAPIEAAENAAEPDPSSPFGMGLYLYRYGNWAPACERWNAWPRWVPRRA